jgi:hypothetical protein
MGRYKRHKRKFSEKLGRTMRHFNKASGLKIFSNINSLALSIVKKAEQEYISSHKTVSIGLNVTGFFSKSEIEKMKQKGILPDVEASLSNIKRVMPRLFEEL